MRSLLRHFGCFLAILATSAVCSSVAQGRSAPLPKSSLSFAVTYNAGGSNLVTTQRFWLQGGGAELSATFYRGFGAAVSVIGLHTSDGGEDIPVNFITTTFGPRYDWAHNFGSRKLVLFGQGLIGEANGFSGLYPSPSGATDSADSLALQVGGGADLHFSHHLGLRIVQADWIRTQFPNSGSNVQNNLRLGAGIILHSGTR